MEQFSTYKQSSTVTSFICRNCFVQEQYFENGNCSVTASFTLVFMCSDFCVQQSTSTITITLSLQFPIMPIDTSARREDDDTFFTSADFELFSLFVQYPDMTSNPEESTSNDSSPKLANHGALQPSSPSTVPDEDIQNSSFVSFSTARTTPLRPLVLPELVQPRHNSWAAYLRLVQECNLPQKGLQYFTALGQAVVTIGATLFCAPKNTLDVNVLGLGKWLITCVSYSSYQIKRCISRIGNLGKLSAFSYDPAESQAWSTYQQRARLILA